MRAPVARAVMALATCCMDRQRGVWAAAMRAEFDTAVAEGKPLSFAVGCLVAAWRDMLGREEGWLTLTSYALALGVMVPMAALQIGCALLGLPYLYPGHDGLPGALLEGSAHENLVRGIYQAAVPSLALLLVILGVGHLRLAWAMLEGDWAGVRRCGAFVLAATVTLVMLMGVLFLDGRQALFQGAVLAVELTTVALVARWQTQQSTGEAVDHPG